MLPKKCTGANSLILHSRSHFLKERVLLLKKDKNWGFCTVLREVLLLEKTSEVFVYRQHFVV